jgi:peptide/nickel transport system substrate-binding protein
MLKSNSTMKTLIVYLLAFFCLACQPASQTSTERIRFAVAQMPLNLDPRDATDAASERVNRLIYQQLVDFDAASKPMPSLASWEKIDEIHYVFTLKSARPTFHDGKQLTSHDVKATYDSLRFSQSSPHAAEFQNIARIETNDENTIVFQLKKPDAHFPSKLIIGILPHDLIQTQHDFAHHPVGSGPLKFVDWSNNLTLQRLHDKQNITLIEAKDPMVRVLKLQRGEVDLLQGDLPPELVKYSAGQKTLQVKAHEGANFSYLGLNLQDEQLKKISVRKALAYAIDREAIIKQMLVEKTRLAGAILPPEHFAGNANLTPYTYQPALAKKLLQEAGIQLPLKLEYKTSTDAQRVRIATILQAQMAKAGIQLSIKSLDWGTFFADVKKGQFQLFGLTWVGIKTPEIYQKAFHSQAVPPNGFNRGRFANQTLDQWLAQQDWQKATALIHEELPYIPLWYEGQFIAAQKKLAVEPPPADGNWDMLLTIQSH